MLAKLPVRIMGPAFNLAWLLAITLQLGFARSANNPPVPRAKNAKIGAVVIDTTRYLGLTIFNFETVAEKDDERIRHSAQHGCNAVEITINWDRIYPTVTSTAYWDVVDSHVQTAQRAGLKIALRVHIGRDADKLGGFWGANETMQAADSSRNTKTGIVQFSFAHQPTIDRATTFVQEVANRYHYLQEQGQLLFFSVVSSPALEAEYTPVYDPPSGSGKYVVPYDYSVHELTAFRQYLQARFSLAQLNQRWGSDFSNWNKVMPPANVPSNPYAAYLGVRGEDWYVFRHRQLKKFIDKINGTVKGVDPDIVVVNQHGCVWDRLSGLRATFGFKNLGETADGLKFNDGPDYNHRFSMDLVRSNLKPGAFMINAVDGMFHPSVSAEKYYEQISQCFEHGAKMLTLANFGGMDARPKLEKLIHMVVDSNKLLQKRVTPVQTVGAAIGYKLSDILKSYSIAQERWNQRYSQNGKKPVRIELDEDLLRNEPPVINSLPVLSRPLVDQDAIVGQPFSYSVGQAFTDSDGTIVSVEANNLPLGIQWSSATGQFSGTPTRVEASIVTLTARDNLGATVTGSFRFSVTDPATTNQPPVAPIIVAQTGQIGTAFSYTLSAFTDPEGLPLVHSLVGIPAGLTFSAENRVLSGTPTTAGVYSLTYSASDPSEVVSNTFFQLTVREIPPPPIRTGNFEGYLDTYNCEGDIWGWVWDRNLPNTPMPIEVLDGLNVIGKFTASLYRPDLVAAKKGNGQHGYQFMIPNSVKDGLPHVISMRIENSEYYLKGSPRTLICPTSTAQTTDPSNKPPVAVPIPIQTAYLQVPFTYTLPEFLHEDEQTLIYAVSGGVAGLTYDQATRTFSGSPTQVGTFTASVIVSDGEGGYTPATVTVVVTMPPANRPPVVAQTIPDQTAMVDQAFTYTIPGGTFTDPDNNLSSLQVTGLPAGLSFNAANRVISGTPTMAGAVTVTVKAIDTQNASVTTTFKITTEAAPNQPPVVAQTIPDQTGTIDQAFTYVIPAGTFTDPDNNLSSVQVNGLPNGLSYSSGTRTISGTPTTAGTVTVSVKAVDALGAFVTTTFKITVGAAPVQNQPPVIVQTPVNQTAIAGQAFNFQIPLQTFSDPDGTIVGIAVSGLPNGLIYTSSTWTISGTLTTPQTATIALTATDNDGATATVSFQLAVVMPANQAPRVSNLIPNQLGVVGEAVSYTIAANVFSDPDGSIAKVEVVSGLPSGLTYAPATRIISGMPTTPSSTTVTVKATDNDGASVTTTFRFIINPAPIPENMPPVVTQTIPDQTAIIGQNFNYAIAGGVFTDPDGTISKVEVVSDLPDGLTYEIPVRVISGTPSKPAARQSLTSQTTEPVTTTVVVKATDNHGGWVTTSFRLTVNPAPNVLPTVAQTIPDQTATVGKGFTYTIVEEVFADEDGNIAKVDVISGLPAGLTYSQSTRVISGTPTTAVTATVTVKATDNDGGTVTTTFRITVSPAPNVPPTVAQTIPDQTATAGQSFAYTIAANVFADSDGSIAKVEVVSGLPAGLTYTQNTRAISGTPTAAGTSTVTVRATDNQNATVTTTFRMIVGAAPNMPPTVAQTIPDQTGTVGKAFTYTIGAGVFADADGSIAKVEVVSGLPAGLTYTQNTRVISGTPTTAATSTLTVRATDNLGATVSTTFRITVSTAPNEPPTVAQTIPDQTATVGQGFTYTIATNVFADSDGSISKVEVVSGLPAGLTFTPATRVVNGTPTTAATSTVTVRATDNQNATVTTTFRITVNPAPSGVNQPPVLVKALPDLSATASVEFNYNIGKPQFTDPDGSIASVDITNLPAGLAYNKGVGIISGAPKNSGVYTVTAKAIDNKGASLTVNFTITVIENAVMKLYKAGRGPEPQNYLRDLNDGDVLYANNLPASVNVFFEFVSKVESAKFELRGPKTTIVFSENFAPWALCGDNNGTPLVPGLYTLKVTGYKKPNLQSNMLVERLISFEVKSGSGKRENAEAAIASSEPATAVWGVYPNPFRDQLVVTLPDDSKAQYIPLAPYRFSILSPSGQQFTVSEQNTQIEGGKAILNVQSAGLKSGLYFLQIRRGDGLPHTLKILKE